MQVGSVVLLHSPLVTAATWGEFPAQLRQHGLDVHVVDVTADSHPPYAMGYVASAAQQLMATAPPPPLVLVGHSGAGPLLPPVGRSQRSAGRPLGGYVFLDAGLPRGGATRLELLGDEDAAMAAAFRADLEAGGSFPRWSDADLDDELPDPVARGAVVSGQRPRGLDFFTEPLPGSDDWPDAPSAYLRTSDAYVHWARVAELRGWDVVTHRPHDLAGHFAALSEAPGLATTLVQLLSTS